MSKTDNVRAFHKVYGVPIGTTQVWDKERLRLRMGLIHEEARELMAAKACCDAPEMLDALCDLVYVCIGFAVEMGWDFDEAWRRVHLSNLSKLGEDGKPIRREDGKVLKGPHFKPPDLRDLVEPRPK